ncbi:hypothetical protein EON65_51225 [archaeon]|nr:MAG: hypothetical protein EON65_51225 [archaeon]
MLLRASQRLSLTRQVKYRQILSSDLNSHHNPNKNIEDDGYSYYKQKTFMDRLASNFQDHPQPGTLILVRHGEFN